ncbi:MAG: PEP-CTERM sorting domain-containing protein [Crocosphaera sp.]|uniref:PEP-CTERM sorting domain-containing protein n=1 Tax=Crocosphaera sp. TaxID=2729996 RepID=UPI002589AEE5|nr:PEP-CTERM sorting domain-containing protein [Crocosphaera sp.]MCH2244195.1 PEP-CTERM sorting domain-containing protein [Crocosphaera sp.]
MPFLNKNGGAPLEIDNLELTPQEAQSTPEPGAILGLLAVSSIGALARRKKG